MISVGSPSPRPRTFRRITLAAPLRPFDRVVRLHASTGTTGRRKVLVYTAKDIDDWANMFARCYEFAELTPLDRVQICVGYGVWTPAWVPTGMRAIRRLCDSRGTRKSRYAVAVLVDFRTTVICSTASMALLMPRKCTVGIKDQICVKKVIFGAERSSDAMVRRVKELLGPSTSLTFRDSRSLRPGTGWTVSIMRDSLFHRLLHHGTPRSRHPEAGSGGRGGGDGLHHPSEEGPP